MATPPFGSISPKASARLESLRGIAALVVAVFHSLLVIEATPARQYWVPEAIFIFNGRAAVTLFFVLSGFVLGTSLCKRSGQPFSSLFTGFVWRRVLRILPAVWASTGLVLMFLYFGPERPYSTASLFVNTYFPAEVQLSQVFGNLLLLDHNLNDVTWTLKMEMLGSMLLPFLWLASKTWPSTIWAALGVCLTATFLLPSVVSIAVLPAFILGFAIIYTVPYWSRVRHPRATAFGLSVLGVALLLIPKPFVANFGLPFCFSYFPEAVGATLVISVLANGPDSMVGGWLESPLLRWTGRVSYSYYLLQPVALIAISTFILDPLLAATSGQWPLICAATLWLFSTLIALPAAGLFYKAIESPFIALSKTLPRSIPKNNSVTAM